MCPQTAPVEAARRTLHAVPHGHRYGSKLAVSELAGELGRCGHRGRPAARSAGPDGDSGWRVTAFGERRWA